MRRTSGILMHISSLMGEYGIGGFSKNAEAFIDEMLAMGFHIWQILPITAIGAGNSPYSGFSAYAGNYLFIDPERIPSHLVTKSELEAAKYRGSAYSVDYDAVKITLSNILHLAFMRLTAEDKFKIDQFVDSNIWLKDYAMYMVIKKLHNLVAWDKWEIQYRDRDAKALLEIEKQHTEEIYYYYFEQYEFFRQWNDIRKYASTRGVALFGDMPIYVSYDSVDVWANRQVFLLDKDGTPNMVAGVPPDYFSQDGQLWGNPIYDFDYLRKTKYKWFIDRILHNLKLYDMLRIDHFRAFHQFWAVDKGEKTAKNGRWLPGAGQDIWKELKKVIENPCIIAEDLGIIDNGVREYLAKTGFYGMRVFHFGFDGDIENIHLPYNYPKSSVCYTGTHDNNTTLGWLYELDNATRDRVLDYIDFEGCGWGKGGSTCTSTKKIAKAVLCAASDIAILPIQDLCGYGSDTRLNKPGVANGNWTFRITNNTLNDIDRTYYNKLNQIYGRKRPIF